MAIKGFLKQERFADLGTIRLGRRVTSGNREHPEDGDTFIVPQEVAEASHPVTVAPGQIEWQPYGNEPTTLEIMVPSSDFEVWCPQELQRWAADERLLCHGDGETAERWDDEKACWMKIDCPYKECEFFGNVKGKGCDERGTLNVILPYVNMMGIYRIKTGSRHGLSNLRDEFNTALNAAINLSGTPEMVRAITFVLTREFKTVHYLQGNVRKPSNKYLLHMRAPNLTLMEAQKLSAAFGVNRGGPMLGSGETLAMPGLPAIPQNELPALPPPPALAMPEPGPPECPKDLVPGASKPGPSVGARDAWTKLLEQVAAIKGKAALEQIETEVCRKITPEAARFIDLDGETEAPGALKMLSEMLRHWQKQKQTDEATPAPRPHGDPTAQPPRPRTSRQAAPAGEGEGSLF